jgi:cysteine synthase A
MNLETYGKLCGDTPLVKISEKIYGKLETFNPTGSVKDRMIYYVVNKAIKAGLINSNTVLCEATSGNSGIALSSIASALGLPCVIFMPGNMSIERRHMMEVYGARIVNAPDNDFDRAIAMRDEFILNGSNVWSPMQFSNTDNIECHRLVTAPEIARQVAALGKEWSAFVHGAGTGGTIEGVRQYVSGTPTRVCLVVPNELPHGIQGIGDGKDFLAHPPDMDRVIEIETQAAINRARLFAKKTGILVGISSGANILAAEEYLSKNQVPGIVVTMLCDRGERYMSIYGAE